MLPPVYPPEAVLPFRNELNVVGLQDLITPQDVDRAVAVKGVTLCVINSVCGCAAGAARPAVAMALQNKVIPDQLTTVFAGMEREAVNRVRELHAAAAPPSSPSIVLFKDGKVAEMFKHCSKSGPSIPPDQYAALSFVQACGSSIPRRR
jgi:putative YphP/YqiW family bacilliredoxin